jgi:hypothetical protein
MTTTEFSQSQTDRQEILDQGIQIEGITTPSIVRYFETMNAEQFPATAALFAPTGAMHPPFESPITGRDAIATYLQQEAQNMRLLPREGIIEPDEDEQHQIKVSGQVATPYFSVNVSWCFTINVAQEITYVRIKLLASPEELLKMQR